MKQTNKCLSLSPRKNLNFKRTDDGKTEIGVILKKGVKGNKGWASTT